MSFPSALKVSLSICDLQVIGIYYLYNFGNILFIHLLWIVFTENRFLICGLNFFRNETVVYLWNHFIYLLRKVFVQKYSVICALTFIAVNQTFNGTVIFSSLITHTKRNISSSKNEQFTVKLSNFFYSSMFPRRVKWYVKMFSVKLPNCFIASMVFAENETKITDVS